MNKDKVQNQNILGTLVNTDESGVIAYSDQIYDKQADKSLEEENAKQDERLDNAEAKDKSLQDTIESITKTGEASAASNVSYNHNSSQLDASNVQQAIDEVYSKGNTNRESTKTELEKSIHDNRTAVDASIQDVYKKSNYNDDENIIDFNTIHLIKDNPEYVAAWVDADNKLLVGLRVEDGLPYYGGGVPPQVKDYIDKQINKILGTDDISSTIDSLKEIEAFLKDFTNSDTLKQLLDLKANADEVKATTDDIYKKSNPNDSEGNVVDTDTIFSVEDNPEYINALTDNVGKLIEAIGLNGIRKFFAGIDIQGTLQCVTDNPEFISVELDKLGHILGGWKTDGDYYFGAGVPSQIQVKAREIYDELSTANALEVDTDDEGNVYASTGINGNLGVEADDEGNVFLSYDTSKVDITDTYEDEEGNLVVEQNKVMTI